MGTSLFKKLYDAHPAAVAELDVQFRMNRPIMGLSNELVYQHRLRCASAAVADFRLPLCSTPAAMQELQAAWATPAGSQTPAWVEAVLAREASVVLVDTAGSACAEERDGGPHNSGEAVVVGMLVSALCTCGLQEGDVGVITPYRAQIKAIRAQVQPVRLVGGVVRDEGGGPGVETEGDGVQLRGWLTCFHGGAAGLRRDIGSRGQHS